MENKNWMEMMKYMQDIRQFCSLYVRRTEKGYLSSAQELDLLSRIGLSQEQMTPCLLCKAMGISKPLVSKLIERLEKKEFIEKEYKPLDKRSYFLNITDKGNNALKQTYTYYLEPVYQLYKNLGENNFEVLISLIQESNHTIQDNDKKRR